MYRIICFALAALLFSTVAFADFQVAPSASPPFWPVDGAFECGVISLRPPDGDRDPIKTITITVKVNDAGNLTNMEVIHNSVFGKHYVRSEQYGYSKLEQEPGKLDATWVGVLTRNPNVIMAGRIFNRASDHKWFYREIIEEHGRTKMDMLAGCQAIEVGD
jgi:hypothetical protein